MALGRNMGLVSELDLERLLFLDNDDLMIPGPRGMTPAHSPADAELTVEFSERRDRQLAWTQEAFA